MHHPKLLRSKCVRSAMIPAALLCVIVSGCADQQPTGPNQQPTGPKLPRVARSVGIPFDKFFVAWSQSYSSGPIETQMFALDSRQDRQYAGWWPDQRVLSFASANPGHLYINGDEPDQACMSPYDYAGIYHDFVAGVRGADPTARVSPAGFAEPNHYCCPNPGRVHSSAFCGCVKNRLSRQFAVAGLSESFRRRAPRRTEPHRSRELRLRSWEAKSPTQSEASA
jgi:hypothetical protein